MKYLYLIAVVIACGLLNACSKKSNPGPVVHTVKFTATGSAPFTAVVSAIKAPSSALVALDTKTVTTGTYEYTTTFSSGDQVHFEVQTDTENTVSYSITDNGTILAQQTGKELSTHTKTSADVVIN